MNTNRDRDRLDDAIDRVVTQMVRVEENDALASQILNALPERASWFGWLFHAWVPRLAMLAIVVTAGIVWGNRKSATPPHLDPLASAMTATQPAALVAAVPEAAPTRTMPLERLEPVEPLEPSVDFDRSLPSIASVASLQFDSLAPDVLPESESLVLESLVIADLPLTPEPVSPR